jgi:hypothetical protein
VIDLIAAAPSAESEPDLVESISRYNGDHIEADIRRDDIARSAAAKGNMPPLHFARPLGMGSGAYRITRAPLKRAKDRPMQRFFRIVSSLFGRVRFLVRLMIRCLRRALEHLFQDSGVRKNVVIGCC